MSIFVRFCLCCIIALSSICANQSVAEILSDLDLDPEHLKYYFNTFPQLSNNVKYDVNNEERKSCWGYELNCNSSHSYRRPLCVSDHKGWAKTKKEQANIFYSQADFGYVRDQRNEMMLMCEPSLKEDSSLECSNHLRFCRGRNILVNFTHLTTYEEHIRYRMDILKPGQIGGFCTLQNSKLKQECDHLSPLQSWGPELQHFTSLHKRPIPNECEIVIDRPTFFMKIDAAVNMYHHFCDFFNLYASLHVNSSHSETFSTDIHILIWELSSYQSTFSQTFEVFTEHPIWDLKMFRGKVVCFKNLVFPLLPRMIFGLYYNTPLIAGCERSGLFHAFSKHILHRLRIKFYERADTKIRITFLSRDTIYRRVLNEHSLIHKLNSVPNYIVNRVVFDRNVPFKKQLEITRNTDIFISIHGAGLTHLLFLPDWAVVFELYNCGDASCYSDLARLRGVKYVTWEDKMKVFQQDEGHHPDGGAHAKFTNYKFDVKEFMRLVKICEEHVIQQESFPMHHEIQQRKLGDEL